MIREFIITEVMLEGVFGEVSGVVSVDDWTAEVESVDCKLFDFRCDVTDDQVRLNASQSQLAEQIVWRTLEADSELGESADCYQASAAHLETPSSAMSESQKVLADYLEHIRRAEAATETAAKPIVPLRRFG